jgi:hypothetical protein
MINVEITDRDMKDVSIAANVDLNQTSTALLVHPSLILVDFQSRPLVSLHVPLNQSSPPLLPALLPVKRCYMIKIPPCRRHLNTPTTTLLM